MSTAHPTAPERLRLLAHCADALAELARAGYPLETCGLLLGRTTEHETEVHHVHSCRNLHPQPEAHFDLDPVGHVEAEARALEQGLQVVGVWHSHPDRPARPSAEDGETAWAGWSHLLVGLSSSGPPELRSWRWARGVFAEQALELAGG